MSTDCNLFSSTSDTWFGEDVSGSSIVLADKALSKNFYFSGEFLIT